MEPTGKFLWRICAICIEIFEYHTLFSIEPWFIDRSFDGNIIPQKLTLLYCAPLELE